MIYRQSSTSHSDDPSKERNSFRDKFSREGQKSEKNGEKAHESRPSTAQNRRSMKDDSDLWSSARQARGTGPDDLEVPQGRNDREYDRDRESERDSRPQRGFESHRRDVNRDNNGDASEKRNGPLRSRNEPSWMRETPEWQDERTDNKKPRDWRDKERKSNRPSERDWNRGGKQELDPEWMDEPEPEEKKQVRTQDDFKKWKARMNAGNGILQETPLSSSHQVSSTERNVSSNERKVSATADATTKAKVDTPLVLDSSFDGFFGLLNKSEKDDAFVNNQGNGTQADGIPTVAKVSKASKFSSLFNPAPDPEPPAKQAPPPHAPGQEPGQESSSEDKMGFQRILKLLDQQQQRGARESTPPRTQGQKNVPTSPPIQSPRVGEQNGVYESLGPSSPPAHVVPQTRDSEFLLNLMQQPQQNRPDFTHTNSSSRRSGHDVTPGILPFSGLMVSPQAKPQHAPSAGPPPGYFGENMREEPPIRDKLNPNVGVERRGPPPGFFDMHGNHQRESPAGAHQPGMPIGVQRPPGFEQFPPGFAQHSQAQRQNVGPPPGFQGPQRGQNAFPPGLLPNMPPDRGIQYGMRPNGPGMGPPGFMGMGGPPPGFPSPPFGQEGIQFGRYDDGTGFGQGFPPGQQRRQ